MKPKNLFKKTRASFRELGKLTPFALATAILPIVGGTILLTVALPLGVWLRENWEIGMPLYFLGVLLFCGLALLATNILGVIAGWAFSFDLGILVLMTGIVGAALVSFMIHTRIAGDRLQQVFEKHPKAKAIYHALVGQSLWRTTLIISLVRMSPAMPFALTNFLMASARVPVRAFITGTFFGMLPRSSAVVFVGSGLSELNFDNPQNWWLSIFGIAATIISIIVIGNISGRALERLTEKNLSV